MQSPRSTEAGTVPERDGQRGVALIIVLWMTVMLSVLVLSFSAETRTELFSAAYFKNSVEEKFLAEAGVQRGIMEVYYRMQNKNADAVVEGMQPYAPDGSAHSFEIGDAQVTLRISDEWGKINLNKLNDTTGILLGNLLVNLGSAKEEADAIVDAILDWKDSDDLVRLHGAESDYYLSLPGPYRARNAAFESPEELLLVKGMTREILYGTPGRKGIIQFITVHSGSDKISLNSAPREVLMSIPGVTEETADRLIQARQAPNAAGRIPDIQATLGAGYQAVAPYVTSGESNVFTLDAIGRTRNENQGYRIRQTIAIKGGREYQILYYRSPSQVTP